MWSRTRTRTLPKRLSPSHWSGWRERGSSTAKPIPHILSNGLASTKVLSPVANSSADQGFTLKQHPDFWPRNYYYCCYFTNNNTFEFRVLCVLCITSSKDDMFSFSFPKLLIESFDPSAEFHLLGRHFGGDDSFKGGFIIEQLGFTCHHELLCTVEGILLCVTFHHFGYKWGRIPLRRPSLPEEYKRLCFGDWLHYCLVAVVVNEVQCITQIVVSTLVCKGKKKEGHNWWFLKNFLNFEHIGHENNPFLFYFHSRNDVDVCNISVFDATIEEDTWA